VVGSANEDIQPKTFMSYIITHKARLARRHYITLARTGTHWYNFYAKKLKRYFSRYGDDFCLVINCSKAHDDAYVLPFKDVKEYFSPKYLNDDRWIGIVRHDNIIISLGGQPIQEVYAGHLHNAFNLLQDAPQPTPLAIESEYV